MDDEALFCDQCGTRMPVSGRSRSASSGETTRSRSMPSDEVARSRSMPTNEEARSQSVPSDDWKRSASSSYGRSEQNRPVSSDDQEAEERSILPVVIGIAALLCILIAGAVVIRFVIWDSDKEEDTLIQSQSQDMGTSGQTDISQGIEGENAESSSEAYIEKASEQDADEDSKEDSGGSAKKKSKSKAYKYVYDPTDFILPDSDKRLLTEEDLAGLWRNTLTYARNEIYARHGYIFQSEELNDYFNSMLWYEPDPSDDGSNLSEIEKQNAEFILAYQERINDNYMPK